VFWLKKVVSFWMMPLPLSMALLVCGILLARFSRRPKLGGRLVLAAAALLILLSNRLVSTRLLQPLEEAGGIGDQIAALDKQAEEAESARNATMLALPLSVIATECWRCRLPSVLVEKAVPFVAIQLLMVALVIAFPSLVTATLDKNPRLLWKNSNVALREPFVSRILGKYLFQGSSS